IAANDGLEGLVKQDGYEWIVRTDAAVQVQRGQTISAWVQFADNADGRAYFAFGTSLGADRFSGSALSLVLAANTNQLLLQQNPSGYGNTVLASTPFSGYQANHPYRMEVVWGSTGSIVGRLYDSDGVTLLASVTGSSSTITGGGIGFR